MSPHQVVAVGVRLFAIWLAIYALRVAPGFLVQVRKYDDQFAIGLTIATVPIVLGVLIVLWFFPRTIARRLLPGSPPPEPPVISPDAWFAVGCSLLGLWVLSDAIPALVKYFMFLYLDQRSGGATSLPAGWHAGAVSYVVHLLIGFWLLLGAKGVRKLVMWARYAGGR